MNYLHEYLEKMADPKLKILREAMEDKARESKVSANVGKFREARLAKELASKLSRIGR